MTLAACGSGESQASGWRDADVCHLLSKAEVARFLNLEERKVQAHASRKHDRPQCVWGAGQQLDSGKYEYEFKVSLWQPPFPKELKQSDGRVFSVGKRKAYVVSEAARSCFMNVAGEPAWFQIDANGRYGISGNLNERGCDRAARLVAKMVAKLSW